MHFPLSDSQSFTIKMTDLCAFLFLGYSCASVNERLIHCLSPGEGMDNDISENLPPTKNYDRSLTMKLALELNSFIVPPLSSVSEMYEHFTNFHALSQGGNIVRASKITG